MSELWARYPQLVAAEQIPLLVAATGSATATAALIELGVRSVYDILQR